MQPRRLPNGRLFLLTFGRLLIDTSGRFLFPFLPAIARGLGVTVADVQQLISLRNLAGLVGPVLVPLSERFGRKPLIMAGLVVTTLGCLIPIFLPTYLWLGVTLILLVIGKVLYGPSVQAYLGDVVPYEQRGRAVAVTEFAWSGSILIGAPIAGYFINRNGWPFAFVWIAPLLLIALVLVIFTVPESHHPQKAASQRSLSFWAMLKKYPVVSAAGAYTMLIMLANQLILISYADWMEDVFNLSLSGLGLTAVVIGSAELGGELISGWAGDRFGKKRSTLIAAIFAVGLYILLPQTGTSQTIALIVMFATFFAFEITVVAALPIYTEMVPESRTTALTMIAVASPVGRGIGAFIAAPLDQFGQFTFVGWVAAGLALLALVIFWLAVPEQS